MRTHFDWLPDAVTREVNTDRGDADCPRKQIQEMPIQWVLVFFIVFSNLENNELLKPNS